MLTRLSRCPPLVLADLRSACAPPRRARLRFQFQSVVVRGTQGRLTEGRSYMHTAHGHVQIHEHVACNMYMYMYMLYMYMYM